MEARRLDALLAHEHFGLMQLVAYHPGDQRRNHADQEHAAPAYHRQQQRREQRHGQHADLPTQGHIRRHARTVARGPGFGGQRHADAELAAQAYAGNRAIDQQIPVALRKRAQAGEHREQHDGPGQHADAAVAVAHGAKEEAADDGADQRPGDQRAGLAGREVQVGRDRRQHEAQDQQIEAVHGVAHGRAGQGLPAVAIDFGGR
ncbi:hypothetical protein D3C86_1370330 [compost metagenome]